MPAVAAHIKTKFAPKRATVLSETGSMGTPGGQQWVDSAIKAGGIPRDQIEWQQYKAGIQGNEWLPYLTKAMGWKSDVIFQRGNGRVVRDASGLRPIPAGEGIGIQGRTSVRTRA